MNNQLECLHKSSLTTCSSELVKAHCPLIDRYLQAFGKSLRNSQLSFDGVLQDVFCISAVHMNVQGNARSPSENARDGTNGNKHRLSLDLVQTPP